jgi:hypothetical protein
LYCHVGTHICHVGTSMPHWNPCERWYSVIRTTVCHTVRTLCHKEPHRFRVMPPLIPGLGVVGVNSMVCRSTCSPHLSCQLSQAGLTTEVLRTYSTESELTH